jgi:hypothetical protein
VSLTEFTSLCNADMVQRGRLAWGLFQAAAAWYSIALCYFIPVNWAGSLSGGEVTMKTHILRGSKQEIVETLFRIHGEVREAIVFEEEATARIANASEAGDIFAEMHSFMVNVHDLNDSREAIYTRLEGE